MDLIGQLERENGKKTLPPVHIGDTVEVHYVFSTAQVQPGETLAMSYDDGVVKAVPAD